MGQPGMRKREGGGEKGVTRQICRGRGKGSPPNTGREPYEATHGAAREEEEGKQEGEESDPTHGGREGEGRNPTDLPRTGGWQPTKPREESRKGEGSDPRYLPRAGGWQPTKPGKRALRNGPWGSPE